MLKYNCTIEFESGAGRTGIWRVTRTFNGLRHLDNYTNYILRTKGWHMDECYVNSGYPFAKGETYYTIENGEVVTWKWEKASEILHDLNPNKGYFYDKRVAMDCAQRIVNNFS